MDTWFITLETGDAVNHHRDSEADSFQRSQFRLNPLNQLVGKILQFWIEHLEQVLNVIEHPFKFLPTVYLFQTRGCSLHVPIRIDTRHQSLSPQTA